MTHFDAFLGDVGGPLGQVVASVGTAYAQVFSETPWWMAVVVAVVVMGLFPKRRRRTSRAPGYVRQEGLFSRAELSFLDALEQAIPSGMRIHAKVRMADVITPEGKSGGSAWWKAFTKVSSKHFDFVVVRVSDGVILAGIELDDRSHQEPDRRARDLFVDQAMAQAGVPLVRVIARRRYLETQLRAQLDEALSM